MRVTDADDVPAITPARGWFVPAAGSVPVTDDVPATEPAKAGVMRRDDADADDVPKTVPASG
jgi:hypothetical protein